MILWFTACGFFTGAEQYVRKPMKSELATLSVQYMWRNAEEHLLFPYMRRVQD